MSEWKPISTAPKDGARVLVYKAATKETYVVAHVHSEVMGPVWATPDAHVIFGATHWMPLPEPPKE